MNDERKHIDVVFDYQEQEQLELIKKIVDVQNYDGNDYFKVHIKPIPSVAKTDLISMNRGLMDMNEMKSLSTKDKGQYNDTGLYVLDKTAEDANDMTDELNWKHLALIFPDKRGKITNAIKIPTDYLVTMTDRSGKKIEAVKQRWVERYRKKILICMYEQLPSMEAMKRYDRVWFTNKNIVKKIRKKCPRCDDYMRWEKDFIHMKCSNDSCPYKKQHSVPIRLMHEQVFFIGENFENLDMIEEYEKVMR